MQESYWGKDKMKREPGGAGRAFRTCANWTLSRGRRDRGTEFGRKCLEWP